MGFLKYDNENLFIDKNNKIILTKYKKYFEFMKSMNGIEENKSNIEYNGFKLSNKNTLFVDLTSINSLVNIFSNKNKLIDEYIKYKIENLIVTQEDEECIYNILIKYLKDINNDKETVIDIDFYKLVKSYLNVEIGDVRDFLKIFNIVLKSNNISNVFVFYKRSILNEFKLFDLLEIENDKLYLFEICDKESMIYQNDNILFFDNEITQIRMDDLFELIIKKLNKKIDNDIYLYLVSKIFFYSINKKEVDIMSKYLNEISELCEIIYKEFKLNLIDTSDYINN